MCLFYALIMNYEIQENVKKIPTSVRVTDFI